jgi:hypothetical protein
MWKRIYRKTLRLLAKYCLFVQYTQIDSNLQPSIPSIEGLGFDEKCSSVPFASANGTEPPLPMKTVGLFRSGRHRRAERFHTTGAARAHLSNASQSAYWTRSTAGPNTHALRARFKSSAEFTPLDEIVEREGFDQGHRRKFLSGAVMRRKFRQGVEFRVF